MPYILQQAPDIDDLNFFLKKDFKNYIKGMRKVLSKDSRYESGMYRQDKSHMY